MNSIDGHPSFISFPPSGKVMRLPVAPGRVAAGFPSPAEDFAVPRLDLHDLIKHPLATFFWRASGRSMIEAGIDDGDILCCDRAITPRHRHIVIANVDGDFTVKYFYQRNGRVKLVPANPTFPELTFKDGQQLTITGVVIFTIKQFVK